MHKIIAVTSLFLLLSGCVNYSMGNPTNDSAVLRLSYGAYKNPRTAGVDKIDGRTVVNFSMNNNENIAYLTPGKHLLSASCCSGISKQCLSNKEITLYAKPKHHYVPMPLSSGDCEVVIKDLG